MKSSSPRTGYPLGSPIDPATGFDARLSRLLWRARAALAAERILPALWPAAGFAGLYFALALSGFFAFIPWIVQAVLLAAAVTATGLSLEAGFRRFAWPGEREAARRLERDSGLEHRPISESDDRLIGEDPFAARLWRLHRARPLPATGLRVAWPHLDLSRRDPRNLRYFLLVALAAALLASDGNWQSRLMRAFDSGAGSAVTLDAWIDPPPYTGLAPVYLAHGDSGPIAVPAGSVLNLRAHGANHAPGILLGDGQRPRFAGQDGEYAATARLGHNAHLRVRAFGHVIGDWRLTVIADTPPVIRFTAKPSETEHQATKFSFHAGDDYGVVGVRVVIRPHGRGGAPLAVDLPLAQPSAKALDQTIYSDLTGHPYAGLMVDAVLEARDGAGQIGRSAPVTFRLPAHVFTDPLARALIEQRQNLAVGAPRRIVADTLDALAIAPDKFYDGQAALYLALRAAYWGVRTAKDENDIAHVENLLWQTAIAIDHNGLANAAEELRRLQALLAQALAAHAPQDVIDALLQRYNQAMQRYMQALANDPSAQAPMQSGQDTKTITEDDLQKLLQTIQQLSASGNREMAAQMLALLQSMLENMHMAKGGAGSGQDKALNQAIQEFGDMMGKERALLDKTMRQRQGNGDPKDGGPQGLARQQGALKKQLDDATKAMDPRLKDALGKAGRAMDNASNALNQQDLDSAGAEEKNALDALRQGADALAKQQSGQEALKGGQEDPLGRASGTGTGVKLPGASDMARARAILQELRKRAGQPGRSQQELDYIERLLREF